MSTENTENITPIGDLKISDEEFNNRSIQGLANRPNASSTFGGGGLAPETLKERFDANPDLIRKRFNELLGKIVNGEVAEQLKATEDGLTLKGIYDAIADGTLADTYLKAKKNADAAEQTLNEILGAIDSDLSKKGEALATKADAETVNENLKAKLDANGIGWDNWDTLNALTKTIVASTLKASATLLGELELRSDCIRARQDSLNPNNYDDFKFPKLNKASSFTLATEEWVQSKINELGHITSVEEVEGDPPSLKITFSNGDIITESLDVIFGGVGKLLENKLDKFTYQKRVYATDGTGKQTSVEYSQNTDPYQLAQRLSTGQIKVPETPVDDSHAASKKYADTAKAEAIAVATEANAEAIAETEKVSNRVDKLEGMLIKYTEDDSVAYEKPVPEASAPKAILSSVGGMSRVVTVPKEIENKDYTGRTSFGGITVEPGEDFEITVTHKSGTKIADTFYLNVSGTLRDWKAYTVGEPFRFTNDGAEEALTIDFNVEGSFPDAVYNLKIVDLNSGKEIQSAPVTAIVSEGENLVNDIKLFEDLGFVKQDNGYWYGSSKTVPVFENTENKKGNIAISYKGKFIENGGDCPLWFVIYYTDGASNKAAGLYKKDAYLVTSLIRHGKVIDRIEMSRKTAGTFEIKDLMLKWSDIEDFEYKPYLNETYEIPEEILALPDYGVGLDKEHANKVDFDAEIYEHKYGVVDLGTLTWSTATYGWFSNGIDALAKGAATSYEIANALAANYNTEKFSDILYNGVKDAIALVGDTNKIRCSSTEPPTGLLVYELAEPEYTDISEEDYRLAELKNGKDYFFIEVQGGGTVRFENEKKLAVPSKITFAEV